MEFVIPAKLRPGSHVRVVAPARSRAMVTEGNENGTFAERQLSGLGLRLSYGDHVDVRDRYHSSAVTDRVADLHAAFADPSVDAVLTVIGGFNSNELLPHLDFDLIAQNPKILCGYSDITALQNAITALTGVVTYSGPHWSTFGMRELGEQTSEWFCQTLMSDDPVVVRPGSWFTEDPWFLNQDHRTRLETDGWWVLNPGRAEGRVVGGNLCTFNLLQGTRFMPSLAGTVLFVEDDALSSLVEFRRHLHSLMQVPGAEEIRGLVIGRFERASRVEREDLELLIGGIDSLTGKPVVANVDFGHTNPLMTFPIGGYVQVEAAEPPSLVFTLH
jgi:muramoyltetrapeptide carboxypeptidase LdcA involved in peptidoglycan recycling